MPDLDHSFGGDLSWTAAGGLLTAASLTLSQERVLRRLLTNPGDYLWHPDYGAGLGSFIGQPINVALVTGLINAQMGMEATVARTPAPVVTVSSIPNGMSCQITYTETDTGQPATVVFSVVP